MFVFWAFSLFISLAAWLIFRESAISQISPRVKIRGLRKCRVVGGPDRCQLEIHRDIVEAIKSQSPPTVFFSICPAVAITSFRGMASVGHRSNRFSEGKPQMATLLLRKQKMYIDIGGAANVFPKRADVELFVRLVQVHIESQGKSPELAGDVK
ncbi:MAG: hypothetical protein R3E58_15725 [Phycisphaerae bacterium]